METSEETEFLDCTFEDKEYGLQELANCEFERCVFRRCRFGNCRLSNARFIDCRFETCDLTASRLQGATFANVVFSGCRAIGVDWTETSGFRSVHFSDCKLSDGVWRGMDLRHAKFESSLLEHADFERSRLDKASFSGSRLEGARFVKTSLLDTDLSTAEGYVFDPRVNQLKNTKIGIPEALAILEVLGAKIVS